MNLYICFATPHPRRFVLPAFTSTTTTFAALDSEQAFSSELRKIGGGDHEIVLAESSCLYTNSCWKDAYCKKYLSFVIHLCCRIIGLYVGFVWLVGKFVRLFFTSISYRIMFDEMPNVDKVLKLCLDIFMVRESKELELEEDLFAKLMFLYRSPQTLIKWTKYKRQ